MRTQRASLAAAVLAGVVAVQAEDLAWKFDVSARPADVVVEATAANAADVSVAPPAEGASGTIPLFDSRWNYSLLLEGWTYRYVQGLFFIVR